MAKHQTGYEGLIAVISGKDDLVANASQAICAAVDSSLENLDEVDREAVMRRFGLCYEPHTYKEIGQAFGKSRTFGRDRVQRGLRVMRHRKQWKPILDLIQEASN